jgi:tetrahydromethanopterin S-methyltransferase subunit C
MIYQSRLGLMLFSGFIGVLVGFGIPYIDNKSLAASAVSGIITMVLTTFVALLVHQIVIAKRR